ncbi:MAG: hypothetical protein NTX42_05400 [Methanothrix sp.]|nr:hypothetical protein [Methanothrix sp.]
MAVLQLGDPCELSAAAPGSRSTVVADGARGPAATCGRCMWAGPSGLAALSSGRDGLPDGVSGAGGRLGLRNESRLSQDEVNHSMS